MLIKKKHVYVMFAHLFVKYFGKETTKWPLQSSNQAATCYYQSSHPKVEAIPVSSLTKSTKSELARLSSHYHFLMFHAERQEESCENQLLKFFSLIWRGDRAKVYLLRDHAPVEGYVSEVELARNAVLL